MSAPAPAQAQANPAAGAQKPAAAPGQAAPPTQAPAGGAPAQQPATAGNDVAALKNRLRTEYPQVFATENAFTFTNTTINAAQGFRFRLDRTKADVKTRITAIGKKGGLLAPAIASSATPVKAQESSLINVFSSTPALRFKALANPAGTTEVYNAEINATAAIGQVKVTQSGDIRTVAFFTAGTAPTELVSANFFAPLVKGGCCSAPAPAKLSGIRFALGKSPKGVTWEENPNGDTCVDHLEINLYFGEGIDAPSLVALTAVLEVSARELI